MKKHTKILSLLLAIVMVFAVTTPVFAQTQIEPETTNVVIHKILMSKEDFDAHDINKEYNPLTGIEDYAAFFGGSAKDIPNIVFDIYAEGTFTGTVPNVGETPIATYTSGSENPLVLVDGTYLLVENHEASSYVGEDGSQLTEMKAVPMLITLPLENENGRLETVHLYPKNTEDKPTVVKTHDETEEALKMKKDARVGEVLPYVISTTIPVEAKYATATWTDQMTEGLTLQVPAEGAPFTITVGGTPIVNPDDYTYTLGPDGRSFTIDFTEKGLALINDKETTTDVVIKYDAVLNDLAAVEVPEANDVFFHYGNKDEHGNTPIPTKPELGQITVEKSFADGTEAPAAGIEVALVDAQTGVEIERVTLGVDPIGWTYTWTGLDNEREYKVVELSTG